jgi:hypothetical protein
MYRSSLIFVGALLGALALGARSAPGAVNLEFRPVAEACATRSLALDLFAVSDTSVNQSISAMDVIIAWDPLVLQLIGIDNSGPYSYSWLFSGFTNDQGLEGLNNTWLDGNALYTALAQLGTPPVPAWATPSGMLVARFKFRKLQVGVPVAPSMLPQYGVYAQTVVYDGIVPGLVVTGLLNGATLLPRATGDTNCDHVVGFGDINPFVLALTNAAQWQAQYPGCSLANNDINCDGFVNFADINPFVALLSSN